ncbi:MAG: N-acetylmuramoyl-L-alanine amidase [Candidatus Hydrogenedentota bacterium]
MAVFLLVWAAAVPADTVIRESLEEGVYACIRGGRSVYLEVMPPSGDAARPLFDRYLADSATWTRYRDRQAVAVPLNKVNASARRDTLLALFPDDYVDDAGWWHVVLFDAEDWECVARWFTGSAENAQAIAAHAENAERGGLRPGVTLLIPRAQLPDPLRKHKPKPTPSPPLQAAKLRDPGPALAEIPVNGDQEAPLEHEGNYPPLDLPDSLEFATDDEGPHAVYRLQRGEALYTAVAVRFTDFRDHGAILEFCETIRERSGIRDVRRMKVGQIIRIPIDLLSDRFAPEGSERRTAYEAMLEEADRLRKDQVASHGLDGVVVILDPGHGGRDQGAASNGLYEDELVYDIACRLKRRLERDTHAKVYMTLRDLEHGFTPRDVSHFQHETNEVLLTTPPYRNTDARISANLRWYLANHIYRKERAAGVDERQIVFISLHCDMLFNTRLRGAMVYVPGAKYRRDRECPSGNSYNRYTEVKGYRTLTTNGSARRRDEALSHNFAVNILDAMRQHDPPLKVHSASQPIRNVIRQSGGRAYVPAVLRNTLVPTKVLVEAASMNNRTDRTHLANPKWREWFASALVDALKKQYEAG